MDPSRLRNIGVAAHIDAGKTTVSECILFCSGVEHRVGLVDEGTTVLDWMSEERERGITISAAATRVPWRDGAFQLIDTPGHVDFTVEVERCMRVLDGAVLVIDAVAGVQAQTETVWRQMRRHDIPSIAFVNKCDRTGADFLGAVESLRARLGAPAVPVQYPLTAGGELAGVVDLVERRALTFDPATMQAREVPVPEELADEVDVLRSDLFELLCERDEELLSAVVEEEEVDPGLVRRLLREATIAGELQPVLCGAALQRIGIPPLMDAIEAYLPSPLDRPPVRLLDREGEVAGERGADPEGELTALAFKLHLARGGDQTFVRLYSGRITVGQELWNPRTGESERVGGILRIHAEAGEEVLEAAAGDIVALLGLERTGTGDTLGEPGSMALLEPPTFPEPVMAMVAEPAGDEDRTRLGEALARLAHEDPSLRVRQEEATGQWLVEGMGELHLEVIRHRLRDEFGIEPRVGAPRVSYREAVRGPGRGSSRVDRVVAGEQAIASCELEVHPAAEGERVTIEWSEGVGLSAETRTVVESALLEEAAMGPRFGHSLLEGQLRILALDEAEGGESDQGCALAAVLALREAMERAEVVLLEPVMRFQVETPEEFAGGIQADLGSRRAEVGEVRSDGVLRLLSGRVALFGMLGYSTDIRSLSQGRAAFSMVPDGLAEVPGPELASRGLVWS